MGILSFLGHQLTITSCTSDDLATLSHFQFDIVNQRACRDVTQGKGIARFDVSRRACDHLYPYVKLRRSENIPLLPIDIMKESDPGGSVRVVFDGCHFGRNFSFVPFEIDEAILPLVASSAMPGRDPSIAVPSSSLLHREKEALLRSEGGDLLKGRYGLKPS